VGDGVLWGHTSHVLPEVIAPARGDVLSEAGRGRADQQRHRERRHTNQSSYHHGSLPSAEGRAPPKRIARRGWNP